MSYINKSKQKTTKNMRDRKREFGERWEHLYISKSWGVAFIIATFQLSHISIHVIILFLFKFCFNNFFNISSFFLISTFSPTFLIPLHLHLPNILYFNITLYLSLHLPLFCSLFCLFLFTQFYYKFVIISSIICIAFPHNKGYFSLCLLIFWLILFIFLTSLL